MQSQATSAKGSIKPYLKNWPKDNDWGCGSSVRVLAKGYFPPCYYCFQNYSNECVWTSTILHNLWFSKDLWLLKQTWDAELTWWGPIIWDKIALFSLGRFVERDPRTESISIWYHQHYQRDQIFNLLEGTGKNTTQHWLLLFSFFPLSLHPTLPKNKSWLWNCFFYNSRAIYLKVI
jgi:hypothetical protein